MAEPGGAHHPPQEQDRQPGRQHAMRPAPRAEMRDDRGTGRFAGKVALVSGGDSGIGRAVAIGFAKEGADVAIVCLEEHDDAEATRALIEEEGRRCMALAGIPASFPAEKVEGFGGRTNLGRPLEPDEVAPCYIFLASNDAVGMTGQVLHPNGGEISGG